MGSWVTNILLTPLVESTLKHLAKANHPHTPARIAAYQRVTAYQIVIVFFAKHLGLRTKVNGPAEQETH